MYPTIYAWIWHDTDGELVVLCTTTNPKVAENWRLAMGPDDELEEYRPATSQPDEAD